MKLHSTTNQICTGVLTSPYKKLFSSIKLFLMLFLFTAVLTPDEVKAKVPVIDGNPSEWPGILNNVANTKKAFRHDPFNANGIDDGWTQGSQDGDADPSTNWHWVFGNSNDKGDIGNAGAILLGTKLY